MRRTRKTVCLFIATLLASSAIAEGYGPLPQVETDTFDKEEFVFPDDLSADKLNVLFLSMSEDQDNGTLQGEQLLDWHLALAEQGFFSDDVVGYHFAVFKAPFFVKGMIRNAMSENYEGKIPADQAGILFVKPDKFVDGTGLVLDDQPTIVFVSPDKQIQQVFKGALTDEGMAEVVTAASAYRGAAIKAGLPAASSASPESSAE